MNSRCVYNFETSISLQIKCFVKFVSKLAPLKAVGRIFTADVS